MEASEQARPVIAISQGFVDYGDYVGYGYGRPLLAVGALPALLPYYEREHDRAAVIDRVDGLVLAGGRDIESRRYGREVPHPAQVPPMPHLDEIELSYARLAVGSGVPLLGVCRGAQVLNVAFGGTLHGDLSEFPGGADRHPGAKWAEWRSLVDATLEGRERPPHPSHPVEVLTGSHLSKHLGHRCVVSSYHHQAVDELGDGLVAAAWTDEGVVEAVEMPEAPAFALGVQWEIHEEWQEDDRMRSIWRSFAAAASDRLRRRSVSGVLG